MFVKLLILLIFLVVSASAASAQRTIDGETLGIINGKAIYLPKPEYPPEAADFCARGKVEIRVLIGDKGEVLEAEAISGDELLRAVSVAAVKKAKFSPPSIPVKVKGLVVFNFDSLAPKCVIVGIVNKKALKIPKPSVQLNRPKIRVIIAVEIMVDVSGKVTAARAVSGNPLFRLIFEKAARQAEFPPSFINGPPIKVKALLIYKFKSDGKIETDIEKDDKDVVKTPVNLVEPPLISCSCKFGSNNPKVVVVAEIDEQGNVVKATAVSGHPILKLRSEKAAVASKFLPLHIKSKLYIVYNFEPVDRWSVKSSGIEIKTDADLK